MRDSGATNRPPDAALGGARAALRRARTWGRPSGVWAALRWWCALALADLRLAWSHRYVRHGVWGMCLVAAGAFTPAFLPPDSPILSVLGLTSMEDGASRVLATGAIVAGMGVLLHAWLRLRPSVTRAGPPTSTWFLWSLPVLLCPPLFSRDAYSYAAQGLIVDRGMDPYTTAPISVPGPFADQVDALWLYTPAPYGPLALQTQHLLVDLSFGNAYVAAVGMRLPALLSVAVLALVLPRLAERLGLSRDGALWLGVLNPLVVLHLVGGAHNDAMMIALVVVGLFFATEGRLVPGALAVAAGAGYKQTAVLALIGVAALVARRAARGVPPVRDHLLVMLRTGLVAFAGFAVLTLLSGLGWGWIPALAVPMALRSLLSPPTLLGNIVQGLLTVAQAPPGLAAGAVGAVQAVAAVAGALVVLWCAFVFARRRPMTATTVAFVALVAAGPVVQPWYVLPIVALLALCRPSVRVLQVCVWLVIGLVGYSAFDVGMGNGVAVVGVAVIAWAVLRLARSRTDVVDAPFDPALGVGVEEEGEVSAGGAAQGSAPAAIRSRVGTSAAYRRPGAGDPSASRVAPAEDRARGVRS